MIAIDGPRHASDSIRRDDPGHEIVAIGVYAIGTRNDHRMMCQSSLCGNQNGSTRCQSEKELTHPDTPK